MNTNIFFLNREREKSYAFFPPEMGDFEKRQNLVLAVLKENFNFVKLSSF